MGGGIRCWDEGPPKMSETLASLWEDLPQGYSLEIRMESDSGIAILTDENGAFFERDLFLFDHAEQVIRDMFNKAGERGQAK